jgi:ACS family D-galactonate transporter-like MFS transporter
VFNLATNLAGIVTPLGVGFIVKATGSFVGALVLVACLALLGAFSYLFILGDVKRVEID